MASNVGILIAEAVKSELNTQFAGTFTATREYLPQYELEDMATLHVVVAVHGVEVKNEARGKSKEIHKIDVGIMLKPSALSNAILDALMAIVQDVLDFLRQRRLSTHAKAICLGVENEPAYSQEHLQKFRQFSSVLTFSFQEVR